MVATPSEWCLLLMVPIPSVLLVSDLTSLSLYQGSCPVGASKTPTTGAVIPLAPTFAAGGNPDKISVLSSVPTILLATESFLVLLLPFSFTRR